MSPLLAWVIACCRNFIAYYEWRQGNPLLRSYHLKIARKDFEIALAIWKVKEQRRVHERPGLD